MNKNNLENSSKMMAEVKTLLNNYTKSEKNNVNEKTN